MNPTKESGTMAIYCALTKKGNYQPTQLAVIEKYPT